LKNHREIHEILQANTKFLLASEDAEEE